MGGVRVDLYLVRHGESEDNELGVYSGSSDCNLSLKGIANVKALKPYLKKIKFEKCISSPLKRCIQTANILFTGPFEIDERLREINFGIFEGLSYNSILERFQKEVMEWNKDFVNYKIPNGESLKDLYIRTEEFIKSLDMNNKKLLIVTHGGVIRCFLCYVFNDINLFYKFQVDPASITIISIHDDFTYIKALNVKSIIPYRGD